MPERRKRTMRVCVVGGGRGRKTDSMSDQRGVDAVPLRKPRGSRLGNALTMTDTGK
jgi:hypothetical protein